ncbi:MAG: hypothetical protein IT245_06660 [Bacteroidia bacterium]|nr:hypothetical protein [Bacteroidia bacterium]
MKFYASTIILLLATTVNGMYNPKMRNNFGANHAILRLNTGYYSNAYQMSKPVNGESGLNNSSDYSMLSNMRLGLEAMIMVNNRGNFSESVSRNRPIFLQMKAQYDGLDKNTLVTAGYAHGLECKASFLFFGQVKGYLSIGAAALMNNDPTIPANERTTDVGARLGYNVYNRTSALQFDTYVFKDKVLVTTQAYKKLGENVLINAGVSRNQPSIGFSAMIGSCRVGATTQYSKNNFQSGVNLTVNF